MGWKDAPVIDDAPASGGERWKSAPVVGGAARKDGKKSKPRTGSIANTLAGIASGAAYPIDMLTQALGAGVADLIDPDTVGGPIAGGDKRRAVAAKVKETAIGRMADRAADYLRTPTTVRGIMERIAPTPDDNGARMARALSEGAGGVLTGLGVGGAMSRFGGPTARAVGSQLVTRPGAQMISGVAGAGASEEARQLGAPPSVQIGASILGGLAAPTAADAIGDAINYAGRRMSGQAVREEVGRLLREQASSPSELAYAVDNATPQTSGARPTLAEVTRDPGIAGLQRSLGDTGVLGGARLSERLASNARTRGRAIDQTLGAGDPQAMAGFADDELARLAKQAESARFAVGPSVYAEDSGRTARDLIDEAYSGARARTSRAYNAPPLLTPEPLDIPKPVFEDIMQQADAFYGNAGGVMPDEMRNIISDLAGAEGNSQVLANIERRLSDFAGQMSMAGRTSEAGFARRVRDVVSSFADEAVSPERRAALQAARALRSRQGDVFESGAVGRVTDRSKYGAYTLSNERVPEALFAKGRPGIAAADQLIEAVGPERAEQIAREEMRRILDAGDMTPARLNRIMVDFNYAMRRFPGLRSDVQAARQSVALREAFTKSRVGRLAGGAVDPAAEVSRLMNAQDNGRGLADIAKQIKGNANAMAGLRRSIAQHIERRAATRALTPGESAIPATFNLWDDLNKVLQVDAPILTPDQKIVLTKIRSELAGAQYATTANRTAGSSTVRNIGVAAHLSKWAARQAANKSGAGGLIDAVLNSIDNADQVHALAVDAMLDPKVAAELVRTPSPDRVASFMERLRSRVIGVAGAEAGTE